MKSIIFGAVFAVFIFIGVAMPSTSQALSCLDPESMLEYYVSEGDYIIFTGEAGETKAYVKEAADPAGLDPNGQFDSGYSGQYVEVREVHKGYTEAKQWVYFEKHATWGYLCAGGPLEKGTEALYIISRSSGMFELPQVVNVYPIDSPLATDIITALEESEEVGNATIEPISAEDWKNRLRTDLMDMMFIIKVKLGEWRWWNAQ